MFAVGGGRFFGEVLVVLVYFKYVDSVLCDTLFHHISAKTLRDQQTSLLKLLCAQMSVTCEQGGTPECGGSTKYKMPIYCLPCAVQNTIVHKA